MAKYLNPKADLTFKKVFGEHKELLISFLNALLPLQPGKEIVDIEYLPAELVPVNPDKKDTIVDVRCTEKDGRQFIVEMQMYWTDMFKRRTLFNTCYTLSLVNDVAFPELPNEFYHEFVPTHTNHSDEIIDDMHMVFVELPKFQPSSWEDRKMAVLWLRFLTEIDENTKNAPAELVANALVSKALELVEESGYTDAELLAIDKYWDQISRERTALNAAERKGEAKGRAEGRAEGINQTNRANAKSMKTLGIDINIISQVTGLTKEDIEKL